jgi:hypothetical protein
MKDIPETDVELYKMHHGKRNVIMMLDNYTNYSMQMPVKL